SKLAARLQFREPRGKRLGFCETAFGGRLGALPHPTVPMEPNQSSGHGDGATLLGETVCPLKVTEDIWFGCCSCTYITRDQRVIVGHLAAHGDEQSNCQLPPMSGSKSQVLGNIQKHKGEKPFKCKLCPR
ncbi:unnamed protein product, partial [Ixodes pacificus]